MKTIEEVRTHFSTLYEGMRELSSLPESYPAYSLRYNGEYGVAIEFNNAQDISEESTNAKISTRVINLESGKQKKMLLLTCYDEEYRNEFASLCETFVVPGENGEIREEVLKNPLAWWDKWIGLLGNRRGKKRVYNYLAEMIILHKLLEKGISVVWAAQDKGSHDIESDLASYEVKSTIKRSDLTVTISSQHQLYSEKDLYLAFVRMEKSIEGVSINDLERKLVESGYDKGLLSKQLMDFGLIKGARIRDEKYKVLEIRKYIIDEQFPKITKDSFVGGKIPESITKLTYTIDLANIKYEKISE